MKLSDRLAAAPHVIAREVGDETVLLDLASGTYFGLNPAGARIWQLLESGKSLGEICDAMLDEFDVPRGALEEDALALARELAAKDLVSVV